MHHLSLDEGFWRSAAEALASGSSIDDVDPALVDVTRLLQTVHDSASRRPGGWLALVALEESEAERAASLVLAALLSRHGRSILLVDLHFGDDAWPRLLGAEELEGIVDHVAYGVSPSRLVRPTSWGCLSLLPAGTVPLNPPAILRSDKLRSCIETAGRMHDLVCVGVPFEEGHAWGTGGTAGVDRAILIGPRGDELAYERAIPRLVPRVEVLATLDLPPPGRWRPALGAALPALLGAMEEAVPAGATVGTLRSAAGEDVDDETSGPRGHVFGDGEGAEAVLSQDFPARDQTSTAGSDAAEDPAPGSGAASDARAPLDGGLEGRDAAESSGSDAGRPVAGGAAAGLPLFWRSAPWDDQEVAEDVAFLSRGRSGTAAPLEPPTHAGEPPGAESSERGRSMSELAAGWRDGDAVTEAAAAPRTEEGRWGATAIAVLLCVALGAGAFWYWRANQQIPEGEFTFVETTGTPGAEAQAARTDPRAGPVGDPTRRAEAAVVDAAEAPAAATTEGAAEPATGDDAETTSAEGETSAASAARAAGAEESPRATEEVSGETAAGAADREGARARGGGEAVFAPPSSGPTLPFSLHVGSFQNLEAARRATADLRRAGRTAFVAPVLLEEKGEWYRVFVGASHDGAGSRDELERALAQGVVAEGTVRETPWALYLGSRPTHEAADAELERLARSGVSAYALGDGPVHLYAGAFETAGDAELLNRQLRDRGFEAALVRRRAAEAP